MELNDYSPERIIKVEGKVVADLYEAYSIWKVYSSKYYTYLFLNVKKHSIVLQIPMNFSCQTYYNWRLELLKEIKWGIKLAKSFEKIEFEEFQKIVEKCL